MKAKIKFIQEALGSCSANPELHEEFIASKSADKERIKEELENLPATELMDKTMTVFPKVDGKPILYDYQVRGHIKSFFKMLVEFEPLKIKVGKKDVSFSKWTYKRLVDLYIFVNPRIIPLHIPDGLNMGVCTRPLRADTMRGERVALASSETVPAGTTCEFEIKCYRPELEPFLKDALDYGAHNGLLQWRNSGKGSFEWEEIE